MAVLHLVLREDLFRKREHVEADSALRLDEVAAFDIWNLALDRQTARRQPALRGARFHGRIELHEQVLGVDNRRLGPWHVGDEHAAGEVHLGIGLEHGPRVVAGRLIGGRHVEDVHAMLRKAHDRLERLERGARGGAQQVLHRARGGLGQRADYNVLETGLELDNTPGFAAESNGDVQVAHGVLSSHAITPGAGAARALGWIRPCLNLGCRRRNWNCTRADGSLLYAWFPAAPAAMPTAATRCRSTGRMDRAARRSPPGRCSCSSPARSLPSGETRSTKPASRSYAPRRTRRGQFGYAAAVNRPANRYTRSLDSAPCQASSP